MLKTFGVRQILMQVQLGFFSLSYSKDKQCVAFTEDKRRLEYALPSLKHNTSGQQLGLVTHMGSFYFKNALQMQCIHISLSKIVMP